MKQCLENLKSQIALILVCSTLILCTLIFVIAWKGKVKNTKSITVWGVGIKDFHSDLVVWSGSFAKKSLVLKEAYQQLDSNKAIIQKYLVSKGVKESEIVFSAIDLFKESEQLYAQDGSYRNVFSGYRLTQRVHIESKEIDKIENVSRGITELINRNVEFNSDVPKYFYTKLSDLKLELIGMAAEDARKRASAIAEKSKADLGRLRYAKTDVFQITAQNSDEDFTYGGVYNTAAKNKTANILIKVIYEVD